MSTFTQGVKVCGGPLAHARGSRWCRYTVKGYTLNVSADWATAIGNATNAMN